MRSRSGTTCSSLSRSSVVLRPASVEVAVAVGELERIVCPIFALRLDDVEMREQQNRFARAAPAIAHDKIHVLRCRPHDLDAGFGKSSVTKPRRQLAGGDRRIPARSGSVRLDQLTKNRVAELMKRDGRLLSGRGRRDERYERERAAHPRCY